MKWVCEFTESAQQDLLAVPAFVRKRVARAVTEMEEDPFRGNVKSLEGSEWAGIFRRRLGDYRLLFKVDKRRRLVFIIRILIRSEKSYR
jgi:mRNA-degrading endonuclease RelE of RelBE toxin-antitoxin system